MLVYVYVYLFGIFFVVVVFHQKICVFIIFITLLMNYLISATNQKPILARRNCQWNYGFVLRFSFSCAMQMSIIHYHLSRLKAPPIFGFLFVNYLDLYACVQMESKKVTFPNICLRLIFPIPGKNARNCIFQFF